MPNVLTEASTITCAHNGKITLVTSQNMLRIDDKAVLVDGDLDGAMISGCKIVTDTNQGTKQCLTVVAMSSGAATSLKVDGKGVLLETATGTTDGVTPVPSNTWSVQSAGQTKVEAI